MKSFLKQGLFTISHYFYAISVAGSIYLAISIMKPKEPTIIELNTGELEELLQRIERKQLEDSDGETIKNILFSYVHLTETLKDKNVSLRRLRKMLFGLTTEKTAAILGDDTEASTSSPVDKNDSSESEENTPETQDTSEKQADKLIRMDSYNVTIGR